MRALLSPMMNRFFSALVTACFLATSCVHHVNERQRATAKINYDVGIQSLNRGEMREALRQLLIARRLDPRLPETHQALGLVYHSMNRLDDSLLSYKEAIRLRPQYSEAYNNLGALYIDRKEYDLAIRSLDVALADILYATPTLAEGNLGWAYFKRGDIPEAKEHLGNAVASNPEFCRGHEWLLRVACAENDFEGARRYGHRLFRYCLDQPAVAQTTQRSYRAEMASMVAVAEEKTGHLAEARQLFRRCLEGATGESPEMGRISAVCKTALGRLGSEP